MLYSRRDKLAKFSDYIGREFSKIPLSPNDWTVLSLVPAFITFYLMLQREYLYASFAFAFGGFFDVIDGAVARYRKTDTKKGAYLDTMVDRVIEATIIFGFFFSPMSPFYFSLYEWLFILLFGSMLSTYAKAASAEKGLGEVRGGVLEHTDRMIAYLVIILLLAIQETFWASYLIMIIAILAVFSALQRIVTAFSQA